MVNSRWLYPWKWAKRFHSQNRKWNTALRKWLTPKTSNDQFLENFTLKGACCLQTSKLQTRSLSLFVRIVIRIVTCCFTVSYYYIYMVPLMVETTKHRSMEQTHRCVHMITATHLLTADRKVANRAYSLWSEQHELPQKANSKMVFRGKITWNKPSGQKPKHVTNTNCKN